MTSNALYVYGIVRAGFDDRAAPPGLDEAPVRVQPRGNLAALVSRVGGGYGAADIERNSGEVAWLSPRAMAHDRVLTWAQEHGGVIPLPMFSMWTSDASLERSLSDQAAKLERVFARVAGADEFGLRVYRRDDAAMLSAAEKDDPDLSRMRREADAASPGHRYLLERKIAAAASAAIQRISKATAAGIFETLGAVAREALARPLTPEAAGAAEATLLLNGAFLVERSRLDEFREAVGAEVRRFQPQGLTFDFTGPWPPYNFVAANGGSALRADGA
jgi:hypothetical protein